jgi:hypothetical protein
MKNGKYFSPSTSRTDSAGFTRFLSSPTWPELGHHWHHFSTFHNSNGKKKKKKKKKAGTETADSRQQWLFFSPSFRSSQRTFNGVLNKNGCPEWMASDDGTHDGRESNVEKLGAEPLA